MWRICERSLLRVLCVQWPLLCRTIAGNPLATFSVRTKVRAWSSQTSPSQPRWSNLDWHPRQPQRRGKLCRGLRWQVIQPEAARHGFLWERAWDSTEGAPNSMDAGPIEEALRNKVGWRCASLTTYSTSSSPSCSSEDFGLGEAFPWGACAAPALRGHSPWGTAEALLRNTQQIGSPSWGGERLDGVAPWSAHWAHPTNAPGSAPESPIFSSCPRV